MKKDVNSDLIKSHKLLLKSGMISQLGPGLFSWLPLGVRVLDKVSDIVHTYHQLMGFNKCIAPTLQPAEIWLESGRYNAYGKETMRVKDRHEKDLILGPTAEEAFAHMVRSCTSSAKDLPVNIYNTQWKYRDEIRPRFGIMRCREFLMCDGYSFHMHDEEAEVFYANAKKLYVDMFTELGLHIVTVPESNTGEVGGKHSHQFFVPSETGEDEIEFVDDKGNLVKSRGIEVGHIYYLGTKYSEAMNLCFNVDGQRKAVVMGCYGVGVSRLVGALLEIYGKELDRGGYKINWPQSVAPFKIHLIGSDSNKSREICEKIHSINPEDIYYDDRKTNFGEKMVVADLIGATNLIIACDREVDEGVLKINSDKVHDYVKAVEDIFL